MTWAAVACFYCFWQKRKHGSKNLVFASEWMDHGFCGQRSEVSSSNANTTMFGIASLLHLVKLKQTDTRQLSDFVKICHNWSLQQIQHFQIRQAWQSLGRHSNCPDTRGEGLDVPASHGTSKIIENHRNITWHDVIRRDTTWHDVTPSDTRWQHLCLAIFPKTMVTKTGT